MVAARCGGCGILLDPEAPPCDALSFSPRVREGRARLYRSLLKAVEAVCRPGRLLDFGCGCGDFAALAGRRGWRVTGVEPDCGAARSARESGVQVLADLRAAALPEASFDAAVLWDSLDYARQPKAELEEIFRVLKDDGRLWIRTRNAGFHMRLWRWSRRLGPASLGALATLHRNGFCRAALERALRSAGFSDVEFPRSPLARTGFYTRSLGRAAAGAVALAGALGAASPALLARARKPRRAARVLHLITRLDPGGSSENALLLSRPRPGVENHLACGPGLGEELPSGARLVAHLTRELRPLSDALAFLEILRLLRRLEPDILHTHTSKAGILGRWAARLVNAARRNRSPIKVVHTPYGHVFYGYFGRLKSRVFLSLEKAAARVTDRLVALTSGELRESLGRGVGRADQWDVIPCGVSLSAGRASRASARRSLESDFALPPEALVVGTVSRLERVKGLSTLIESAPRVLGKAGGNVRFLIVGDGSLRESLRAQARRLGVEGRVILAGHRDKPQDLVAGMDVYVQPSLNEGMGKALVDAQALGVAVVASRVCGIPDVVEEGLSALLVPPADPGALAEALLRLLKDSGLRRRLAEAGPRSALRRDANGDFHFSAETVLKRHARLYEELRLDAARRVAA